MSSMSVRYVMGPPKGVRHFEYFGLSLDQLVFSVPGDLSIFFIDDRVVAMRPGWAVPQDLFRVVLPAKPGVNIAERCDGCARIGMAQSDVTRSYGAARFQVRYSFKGWPVERAIYATQTGGSFASLLFTDGVVTEVADLGSWSIDQTGGG